MDAAKIEKEIIKVDAIIEHRLNALIEAVKRVDLNAVIENAVVLQRLDSARAALLFASGKLDVEQKPAEGEQP